MSSELHILQIFKNNLIIFFDELISTFPKEGDLLYMKIFLKEQIPIQEVMKIFIERLERDDGRIKKMAQTHNDIFFIEHNIFEELSNKGAKHFKKLWLSSKITPDDKKTIWLWMDRFLEIADKYSLIRPDISLKARSL